MRHAILSFLAIVICNIIWAQQPQDLPYAGGSARFEEDVRSSLIIEAGDSGRVYFVEISYSGKNDKAEFTLHGEADNDITTMLIRSFFRANEKKWDTAFLKKASVIIPLFISPSDIEDPTKVLFPDLNKYAEVISKSFTGKCCFLYKPVFKFRQESQIDIEPGQE